MDKRQKSTLRSLHLRIADELILDEDFFAALRRDKIFTNGMIDLIKAEIKPRDRVYKMLELLEKRGPRAFENFVWILKENYEWLAEELEEQYSIRCQRGLEERDRNEHSGRQNENEPSHPSNNQYRKNIRAVSTPTPRQRTHRQTDIPTQESVSAGYNQKDSARFFPTAGRNNNNNQQYQQSQQGRQPQASYDSTDNFITTISTSNSSDLDQNDKEYKDACLSPIGIIESSRMTGLKMCSPTGQESYAEEDIQSETDSCDQTFDEIESQTATVISSTDGDIESQFTCTTEIVSEGSVKVSEDYIDAPGYVGLEENDVGAPSYQGLEENDDDFPTSEAYYDEVRRGSSQIAYLDGEFHHELNILDDENETTGQENSYEQSETIQHEERMKTLYDNLTTITSVNENTEYLEDGTVTWEMIESETHKLINRLENSDDSKMIKKCYELFPERERRQPLNVCIETLLDEKKELENKLREKKNEIDGMVFDLWKHQQDMANIKKLKQKLLETESQNDNMKTSLDNLEKDVDLKLNLMAEKDTKIQDLECKLREYQCDQQRKLGATTRRGISNQRRIPNAQAQSPRKQSSVYEPRISMMQGAYGQQSPRGVTTAMRKAQTSKKY